MHSRQTLSFDDPESAEVHAAFQSGRQPIICVWIGEQGGDEFVFRLPLKSAQELLGKMTEAFEEHDRQAACERKVEKSRA